MSAEAASVLAAAAPVFGADVSATRFSGATGASDAGAVGACSLAAAGLGGTAGVKVMDAQVSAAEA